MDVTNYSGVGRGRYEERQGKTYYRRFSLHNFLVNDSQLFYLLLLTNIAIMVLEDSNETFFEGRLWDAEV